MFYLTLQECPRKAITIATNPAKSFFCRVHFVVLSCPFRFKIFNTSCRLSFFFFALSLSSRNEVVDWSFCFQSFLHGDEKIDTVNHLLDELDLRKSQSVKIGNIKNAAFRCSIHTPCLNEARDKKKCVFYDLNFNFTQQSCRWEMKHENLVSK